MCDVPSIAVFCSESIGCFPGTVSKFLLKLLVTIPVASIITGTIVHLRFHIRCTSIHKLLYPNKSFQQPSGSIRTDRHGEANSRFFAKFCQTRLKNYEYNSKTTSEVTIPDTSNVHRICTLKCLHNNNNTKNNYSSYMDCFHPAVYMTYFIEVNRLYRKKKLTVVFYNWLHQQQVSAFLGHHQAYKV